MRTRTRISVAAVLAIGVTAFAVTTSTRPREVAIVDAPLTAPASTVETVTVLGSVADGALVDGVEAVDITAQAAGLSDAIGSAVVTVPDAEPALDAEPAPEGEVGAVSPELVAAAAALDAVAGDAADLIGREAPSGADAPEPASDPCAPTEGAVPEGCPEGARATLFGLTGAGELQVWATADAATSPDMGTSIYCTAAETAGLPLTEGALRLGAITTGEATVTVTYWPDSDPSATASAELDQVAVTVDGSARHCGMTAPLAEGRYSGLALAVGPTGMIANAWPLSFDSRGHETIPPMSVVPLGTNWLWVGVRHTATQTASIKGFSLADGGVATCTEAARGDIAGLRKDLDDHTTAVGAQWLAARNFDAGFTRITSALLYVPEGTSVGLCGYTFADAEPSWDISVPDRIQMATASAPDTWEAVLTVQSVTTSRPGNIYFGALNQAGGWCGTGGAVTVPAAGASAPLTTPVGLQLCRIAGQNMQVEVETFATDGSQDPAANPRVRFLIPTRSCTGMCPEPAARAYTVYLPGLGTDRCQPSAEGDCEVARRRLGASATFAVTWESGGNSGRESWAIGAVAEQTAAIPSSDAPRFDVTAGTTGRLSADGLLATMSTRLRWDREVDYSARIVGACFGRDGAAPAPAPVMGRSAPRSEGVFSADVSIGNLCPGHAYQLVVTATDDAGSIVVAAPAGVPGVAPDALWSGGGFTMAQRHIELTATVEIIKDPSVDTAWFVRSSRLNFPDDTWVHPSFGAWAPDRCFAGGDARRTSIPDTVTLPLSASYDIQPSIRVYTDWYYYPNSPTCEWTVSTEWILPTGVTVSLTNLLAGAEFSGPMVPASFPETEESPAPFRYRVTLTAVRADE